MTKRNNNKQRNISHAKVTKNELLAEIDVDKIINNPLQPRIHIDQEELHDLANSIEHHGLIQPITVIKKDDKFILETGQRRWLAHKQLGIKTIKAIIHEESTLSKREDEKSLFEVAVIENTQRENLNPFELSLSFQNALDKKFYKSREELSQMVGKSPSYIGKVLKVLELDEKIIQDLKLNRSTNDVESLYELQKIKDGKEQVKSYFDFIKKKIDRKGLRELNRSKRDLSSTKRLYTFSGRAKIVKLQFDTTKLTDKEIQDINQELKEVLDKYFP